MGLFSGSFGSFVIRSCWSRDFAVKYNRPLFPILMHKSIVSRHDWLCGYVKQPVTHS